MDDSFDARIATKTTCRSAGNGAVNPPNILRSSRSMEHRAPADAQLRLFPTYRDENNQLQTLHEQFPPGYNQPLTPPPTETKPTILKIATNLSGRDFMADLQYTDRKEAVRNHIIMLNL